MLDSLSPARRRLVVLTALCLVAVLLAVAAFVVVRRLVDRVTPVAQDDPGPVLLVSGYGGSTASLDPLRKELRRLGRDVVVVPAVGGGTGDLTTQAKALDRAADAAIERYDAASVDVVGYSAGGVVARLWVRDEGGASKARRVLSIGSPQHGTDVAEEVSGVASCPTACRQLVPDSSLLRRLNAGDETPRGPRFYSIWSTADQTVVPPSSARLAGGFNMTVQSNCPGRRTSHGGLPSDPVVLDLLQPALSTKTGGFLMNIDCD